jgi:hypothetical protein
VALPYLFFSVLLKGKERIEFKPDKTRQRRAAGRALNMTFILKVEGASLMAGVSRPAYLQLWLSIREASGWRP